MLIEILFVKVKKGRYKIFFITTYGTLEIPQKDVALYFNLAYDELTDSCRVPNIRKKYKIINKHPNVDAKEV